MARVEPNYRSNYYGRRAIRHIGRFAASRITEKRLKSWPLSIAASVSTGYIFNKHYPIVDAAGASWHKIRNVMICVGAAILAGAAVLKALAPAILWLTGKMEDIEVPPSVTDIRILRRIFNRKSKLLNRLNNDLVQFQTSLEKAANANNNFGTLAASLGAAITAKNYEEARDLLNGSTLSQQIIGAYNKGLAGNLARADKGLDPKLYVEALYLTTMRSAGQVLRTGDHARIRATLERVGAILDREDVKGIHHLDDNFRGSFRRASDAAFKLSQAAPPPVTPSVPPPAPTPTAPPVVPPPPPAALPPILGGSGGRTS